MTERPEERDSHDAYMAARGAAPAAPGSEPPERLLRQGWNSRQPERPEERDVLAEIEKVARRAIVAARTPYGEPGASELAHAVAEAAGRTLISEVKTKNDDISDLTTDLNAMEAEVEELREENARAEGRITRLLGDIEERRRELINQLESRKQMEEALREAEELIRQGENPYDVIVRALG